MDGNAQTSGYWYGEDDDGRRRQAVTLLQSFRRYREPLIIDKDVQSGRDLLDHACPRRLLHRGDLARERDRGEKPQGIRLDRRKAQRMNPDPHVDVTEASVGH